VELAPLVFANSNLDDDQKHYCFWMMKDYSRIQRLLQYGYPEPDKMVRWKGIECLIFGRMTSGHLALKKLDDTKVSASAKASDSTFIESAKTLLMRTDAHSSPPSPCGPIGSILRKTR